MIRITLILALFSLLIWDCSTPQSARNEMAKPTVGAADNIGGSPQQQLAAVLNKQSGVSITGSEGNYLVKIRSGVTSFGGNEGPLFVVNRNRLGRDFDAAAQAVAGLKVTLIKVLKDSDATFYGVAGASGVIEITAK